jgi:hypothetical protein
VVLSGPNSTSHALLDALDLPKQLSPGAVERFLIDAL